MGPRELVTALLKGGDPSVLNNLPAEERAWVLAYLEDLRREGKSTLSIFLRELDYKTSHKVTIEEFLEDDFYLGKVGRSVWPRWKEEMAYVLDPKNQIYEWVIDGGIGIGKTMIAVITQLYKMLDLFERRDPQLNFGMAPGSPIIFAFFNVLKYLAEDTSWKYFIQYLKMSPYFRQIQKLTKSKEEGAYLGFPHNIGIALGASMIHALGQNLIGGLLDESNFGKVRKQPGGEREVAQVADTFTNVLDRIRSRFLDPLYGNLPGLLIVVSSTGNETSWLTHHKEDVAGKPNVHISNYPLWVVKPGFSMKKTFFILVGDRRRRSKVLEPDEAAPEGYRTVEVPEVLRARVTDDVDSFLQNVAGVVTFSSTLFLPQVELLEAGLAASQPRKHPFKTEEALVSVDDDVEYHELLDLEALCRPVDRTQKRWTPRYHGGMRRFLHVDLAITQDAAGISMGGISGQKVVQRNEDDGRKVKQRFLTFWVDFMLRVRCRPGSEVDFGRIREFIIYLRDTLHFDLQDVTYDGFQSRGSLQELKKAGFKAEVLSVDRSPEPYLNLKQLILDQRIDLYHYEPCIEELTQLRRVYLPGGSPLTGPRLKIDHPDRARGGKPGSKDVTDALAAWSYKALLVEGSERIPTEPYAASWASSQVPSKKEEFRLETEALVPGDWGSNPLERLFKK